MRVTTDVIIDIPGRIEPAVGRILSFFDMDEPRLNLPILRSGRWPETASEIVVNAPFAVTNGFVPSDVIKANMNGRNPDQTVTGTLLPPEFIYTWVPAR